MDNHRNAFSSMSSSLGTITDMKPNLESESKSKISSFHFIVMYVNAYLTKETSRGRYNARVENQQRKEKDRKENQKKKKQNARTRCKD
jgi:hypothetical protein